MSYNYLKPENLVETFRTSRSYTEDLTDNFFEYERIARNKPHGSIPKEYPKTTDGTTASIIRKTPHRIIQQLPTGKVKSTTNDWLSVVASFIYTDKIIPNANEGYALLQKSWMVVEKFLTFGFCPTYTPFVEHSGYFCTDLRLPYWGDIFIQPGKVSDAESSYIFMRSWWQTADLEALIASQEKLSKGVERAWDVEALKAVKEIETTKDEKAKTPAEREKNLNTKGGVELITGFQRGVKSKFYTFHVQSTGTGTDKKYVGTIVRTKTNKDPRGELPISFAYGDIDGSNPFGRGIIDLVGSLQNLMDSEMQMYQYNRALQLNPPLIKRGSFSKNKIKFAPNTIIDMGAGGPDVNSIEPLKIDTTALANFPNNYGLMQSQMFQLLATPNSTISADVGSVSQSKTPQGVEQNKANLSIDDNYVRKQFETWFERWSETAINLYFAEREGIEELQLDKKTAEALRKLASEGKFDPSLLSEDNKIRINFSTATEALKFEVDASTSKMQDEIKQLQSLTGLEDLLRKSDLLQRIVPPNKQLALWNAFVRNSGTENPEELMLDDKEVQQAVQSMQEGSGDDIQDRVTATFEKLPDWAKKQWFENHQFKVPEGAPLSPPPEPTAPDTSAQTTPDHILKADQQSHQQELDKEKLDLDKDKLTLDAQKVAIAAKQAETQAKVAAKPKPTKGSK